MTMVGQDSPTLARLDEQIAWYDKRSQAAQRRYKALQLTQIIAAASPPEPIGPRQSWIAKAGEVLPQAPIPGREKRALKADTSGIEVGPSTAAELRRRRALPAGLTLDC
jgi:hypothetical protein